MSEEYKLKEGAYVQIRGSDRCGLVTNPSIIGAWVKFEDNDQEEFHLYEGLNCIFSEPETVDETEPSFHPSLAEVDEEIDNILKQRNSLKFRLTIHGHDFLLDYKEIKKIKLMLEAIA